MNKNILMICYYYPPLADVGSKRSIAFAKYLRKYGWNPYVLSVKNPDSGCCSIGTDTPPQGIPTSYSYSAINLSRIIAFAHFILLRVLKLVKINLKRNYFYMLFCIPDYFWGWIPHTVIKGYRIIKQSDIGMIYVSCSPWSASFAGVALKRLTGKPLILDYRDPFGLDISFTIARFPQFRVKIGRHIQEYFFKHVDLFIVNNEDSKAAYLQEYPQVKDKMHVVHNGFEPEFINEKKKCKFEKFTIVYTGEFYFYFLRSTIFFEAIALLKKQAKITRDDFQFLFYGDDYGKINEIAGSFGIDDLILANSRIPYKDALETLGKSHLQLLRIIKPMISTKLFEGIALNIPFLATIPAGEAAEIVKTFSPSSYIITDESAEIVADAICDAIGKYRTNQIQDNKVTEFLNRFSRENLSIKLINIIESNLATYRAQP